MQPAKTALRKKIQARLKAMPDARKVFASARITRQVLDLPQWKQSEVVALYVSLPSEPSTVKMLEQTMAAGKRCVLPKVEEPGLRLYEVPGIGSLVPGKLGILEPEARKNRLVSPMEINLILVPGVAFDVQFNRMGRGKGYYDRLLPDCVRAFKVGICYACQRVDNVPVEPHDVGMDLVIDEA